MDSRQNLRDHSWTGFVSALNLGPSFLKAVWSEVEMGSTAGVLSSSGLQQVAEIRISQGVVSGWQQARLCFLVRNRYHRGSPMAWKKKEEGGMKE